MEKSRGRVHHRADPQVWRDALLHPRSRRLHHRSRTEYRAHIRVTLEAGQNADLNADGCRKEGIRRDGTWIITKQREALERLLQREANRAQETVTELETLVLH